MLLKTYNKVFLSLVLSSSLLASSDILSSTQNDILNLDIKKANQDVSKLSKDWIDKNAITYMYSYSKTNATPVNQTNRISTLSINQSIFRSGGIYYAIKYASNVDENSKLSLKMQKQNLITSVLNTVYNIKKLDIQIKKQNLSLQNALIDYENKKEAVFNGLLDISFLNNAILIKNKTKISLLDIKLAKQNLINKLSTLSDLKYSNIDLPSLNILTNDKFKNENLNIKQAYLNSKKQNSLSGLSNAQYLPKVSVNYSKTINHSMNSNSYKYGFNVVVPIDLKTLNTMQSNKLAYLKTQAQIKLVKKQEEVFFKSNELEIQNISAKIALTKQNIKAYKKLVEQTKEQYDAGLKTSNDVKVLDNSKKSEELSVEIFEIDKQIKLLELYSKINQN